MNREEMLAEHYLQTLDSDVAFEPDGNVPPDFLLNGKIAVEVTRLNEHIEVQGEIKRLDDDYSKIINSIESVFKAFVSPIDDANYWVSVKIKRPFGNIKKTKKKIRSHLAEFAKASDILLYQKYEITDALSFSYMQGSTDTSASTFRLGFQSQHDAGGFVYDEIVKNSKYCIERKSKKIAKLKDNHQTWWLVLVDYVCRGYYPEYIDDFKSAIDRGAFDKVIFIEPLNGNYVFEI